MRSWTLLARDEDQQTVRDDAVKAMGKYSEELERANCSPDCSLDNDRKTETSVQ